MRAEGLILSGLSLRVSRVQLRTKWFQIRFRGFDANTIEIQGRSTAQRKPTGMTPLVSVAGMTPSVNRATETNGVIPRIGLLLGSVRDANRLGITTPESS